MAIYERGYRAYDGGFKSMPGWWTIAREGVNLAQRHRGVRITFWLLLFIFLAFLVRVFVELGMTETGIGRVMTGDESFAVRSQQLLRRSTRNYYNFSTLLVLLVGILVGAGLVANDLRSRALSLYLVRPIHRIDYVVGKALVIPGVFFFLAFLPATLLWLAVGLWQPPGESGAWLADNLDFVRRAAAHWMAASAATTGLMLLVSSFTTRWGLATVIGAGAMLSGMVWNTVGRQIGGEAGPIVRGLDIVSSVLSISTEGLRRGRSRDLPDPAVAWAVILVLFVAGLVAVWWRTRSVELGE